MRRILLVVAVVLTPVVAFGWMLTAAVADAAETRAAVIECHATAETETQANLCEWNAARRY